MKITKFLNDPAFQYFSNTSNVLTSHSHIDLRSGCKIYTFHVQTNATVTGKVSRYEMWSSSVFFTELMKSILCFHNFLQLVL